MIDSSEARVEWLTIAGEPDIWRSIGFTLAADGLVPLFGTSLRVVSPGTGNVDADATGIVGWALSGIDDSVVHIDGLPTDVVAASQPVYADHALGASGLDHLVVLTDDLERTSAAITIATGCELKRVREVGTMRQGFHRVARGGLIVELVERPEVPTGPASFWGLVINVADLDAACATLGAERVGAPKDAVQPGRRIATMTSDAGLGVPVALMTD